MGTPLRRAASRAFGWLADRRLPRFLRAPVYRAYGRAFDIDFDEVRLALAEHPSLGAFFVRRLKAGARPFPADPALLPSPADGRLQALDRIEDGSVLQAKGQPYPVRELLGEAAAGVELEGGWAWTVYLSPRDYHRVHSPVRAALADVLWLGGTRYSVAPEVLARRRVLGVNERAVLRLESDAGPLFLVMVGALNVGRIRVVGVEPGRDGPPAPGAGTGRAVGPPRFERGAELARFEMGSTVVLVSPPGGAEPEGNLELGGPVRMGQVLGRWPARG
jgi:phosphatidylserine decarboxylase